MTAPLFGILIPVLFGVSAFLFALSLLPTKNVLTGQLEDLKTRDPLRREHVNIPLLDAVLDEDRRAMLERRLAEAGWYTTTPAQFVLRVAAGGCLGVMLTLLAWPIFNIQAGVLVPLLPFLTFAGGYAPFFALNRAVDARKRAIQRALPEFLDMVASTVQAGLALNSALGYAAQAAPGPLGEEVQEALSEIRLGRARADALRAAGDRANQSALRNALRVMTQAERLGANVAKILTDLAEDARHQRLMLIEEMAAKLPVKMVFPMVFLMVPAIVTIIFGAVAANFFAGTLGK